MKKVVAYDEDLSNWVCHQISLLKSKQYDKLDIDNLIEEIESVGKSQRQAIESYFVIIIGHMLKIRCQPEMFSRSWIASVGNSRRRIQKIIKDSPSLKRELPELYRSAWEDGLMLAVEDTGMNRHKFPFQCPWSLTAALESPLE
jgi:hypothetical protein